MSSLIATFIRICLFKAGPQDLPSSDVLLVATVIASVGTNLLVDFLGPSTLQTLILSVMQAIVFALVIKGLLQIKNFSYRWKQTMCALFGASSIIRLVGAPILHILAPNQGPEGPLINAPVMVSGAAMGIWSVAVMTVILRSAMEISTVTSFFITIASNILVFIVVIQVYDLLFVTAG